MVAFTHLLHTVFTAQTVSNFKLWFDAASLIRAISQTGECSGKKTLTLGGNANDWNKMHFIAKL